MQISKAKNVAFFTDKMNRPWSNARKLLTLSACLLISIGIFASIDTLSKGLGIWGINDSAPWGADITNFVFWIGIGHAGTLISAILFLFGAEWRNSLNRSAELMTLASLVCAVIFPLIHTGRPYLAVYRLFPYPNQMSILPNFRSPVVWDIFAIGTYFTVSLIFWYTGLIPDMALCKKGIKSPLKRRIYTFLSLDYVESDRSKRIYKSFYTLTAGMATALVISVHSVVSFDFAVTGVPGWHTSILPIYFVAGAIFSGCAMTATIVCTLRLNHGYDKYITPRHLDNLTKTMLATGLILAFCWSVDAVNILRNGSPGEYTSFAARFNSKNLPYFIPIFAFVFLVPHLFWFAKARRSPTINLPATIAINLGMWCERYSLIVPSLETSETATIASVYYPTPTEIAIFAGSFGLFMLIMLIGTRLFPAISVAETSEP